MLLLDENVGIPSSMPLLVYALSCFVTCRSAVRCAELLCVACLVFFLFGEGELFALLTI